MRTACAFVLIAVLSIDARAQSRNGDLLGKSSSASFVFENDMIGFNREWRAPDYDYTSGLRLAVTRAGAPPVLRKLTGRQGRCQTTFGRRDGCINMGLAVTHHIYTPRTNAYKPIPGERPYAGWLYGSVDVHMIGTGHSRTLGVDAGVVGPMSRARQLQNGWHRMFDSPRRAGWQYQIPNAPAVLFRYDEGLRFQGAKNGSTAGLDVHWSAVTGNVVQALSAGTDLEFGTGGHVPWSPREPRVERPTRFYGVVGAQQDLVLRNVFVEGRGGAPGAQRRSAVAQVSAGGGIRWGSFSAEYRHILRGREYMSQPSPNAYGSLVLSRNR